MKKDIIINFFNFYIEQGKPKDKLREISFAIFNINNSNSLFGIGYDRDCIQIDFLFMRKKIWKRRYKKGQTIKAF
jgi:hypothetical protein